MSGNQSVFARRDIQCFNLFPFHFTHTTRTSSYICSIVWDDGCVCVCVFRLGRWVGRKSNSKNQEYVCGRLYSALRHFPRYVQVVKIRICRNELVCMCVCVCSANKREMVFALWDQKGGFVTLYIYTYIGFDYFYSIVWPFRHCDVWLSDYMGCLVRTWWVLMLYIQWFFLCVEM